MKNTSAIQSAKAACMLYSRNNNDKLAQRESARNYEDAEDRHDDDDDDAVFEIPSTAGAFGGLVSWLIA